MKKSTILSIVGGIGVITTTILAVKATPKALKLIEEEEKAKGEELTKVEVVKTTIPVYIPTIISGIATISCIFGIDILNKKQQANLTTSYILLKNSYDQYRKKVKEIYGEDVDKEIISKVIKEQDQLETEEEFEDDDIKQFFNIQTMEYFNAKMEDVISKTTTDDGMEIYVVNVPYDDDYLFNKYWN